ncbi:MBL fold metallo-hydrolase [Streptomyces sp. NPDC057253]|uniref:MBL fold metallo-hydrolase n=1 Tax=Streptomyces sp. NPDC057253 TaxID=3346069 RepID=UPI003642E2D6
MTTADIASIGSLNSQAAVRRLQLDDVTFTYIVDGAMAMPPHQFLSSVPAEYWADHPETLDADGRLLMSAGGLLVERDGLRLLIDAGLGAVTMATDLGQGDSGAFLETLAAVGVGVADIDLLAFTHLHGDHTGWAFAAATEGPPRPTFPRARYVIADTELAGPTGDDAGDSASQEQLPIVETLRRSANLTVIQDGQEVAAGVVALVTPGHSPGHTSYVVTTASGKRLIAFGDTFHTPAQMASTDWGSAPDSDPHAVPGARERLLAELSEPGTIGFGIHFGDQPFGEVRRDTGAAEWHPVETTVLFPPPRTC